MKKYLPAFLFAVLFCSCQKSAVAPAAANTLTDAPLSLKSLSVIPVVDTLAIPAAAVNAKTYGAVGDGVHDDTEALQKIIDTKTAIVLTKGTYIINHTLNLRTGVKIYGSGGAIIKAGTKMGGNLLSYGMYFYLSAADNCTVANLTFQPSTEPFKLNVWANAVVYAINSIGTQVAYNNFNFNQPYSVNGLEAVWISGSRSNSSSIKYNTITSLGIEYAENGASGTSITGNQITHAYADGISAHGNSGVLCTNNVVSNNTVVNSGLMGIEDWGNVSGTVIENNVITGTGKDPNQQSNGMGISAVGFNSKVLGNQLTDCKVYYIEAGGNQYVYNNVINDVGGTTIGIMLNYTGAASAYDKLLSSSILNNTINNCSTAIQVFGNTNPNVTIKANTITNPVAYGISVDSDAPYYQVAIADNKVSVTKPSVNNRLCYQSYTRAAHGSVNQVLSYTSNTITYANTSNGGKGAEFGFVLGTDNTALTGNQVTGNNIKAGGSAVNAISGDNGSAWNVSFIDNKVYGAIVNLQGITVKAKTGNNF